MIANEKQRKEMRTQRAAFLLQGRKDLLRHMATPLAEVGKMYNLKKIIEEGC